MHRKIADHLARRRQPVGLSLLELLVVISIIGLLCALILPAVQAAREAARRAQCASNLRQVGLALHAYHSDFAVFPPGQSSRGFSTHVSILPYIGLAQVFNSVNFDYNYDTEENRTVAASRCQLFLCPSDPVSRGLSPNGVAYTNYSVNFGTGTWSNYNGMFRSLSGDKRYAHEPIRAADVLDGLANTAAVSEITVAAFSSKNRLRVIWNTPKREDTLDAFADLCASLSAANAPTPDAGTRGLPWVFGQPGYTWYNHILVPNNNSCFDMGSVQSGAYTAASLHSGGVHLLRADGSVSFVNEHVDISVWRALGSRNGGESSLF